MQLCWSVYYFYMDVLESMQYNTVRDTKSSILHYFFCCKIMGKPFKDRHFVN
jgi:hypothetical protein